MEIQKKYKNGKLVEKVHFAVKVEMKDVLEAIAMDKFLNKELKKPEYGAVARHLLATHPEFKKKLAELQELRQAA